MIKYIITLLLFLQIIPIKNSAQEVIPSIEFASFNYDIQNYRVALKEYLRVFYFDRDNQYIGVEAKIAQCFSKLEDPDNAIKYFQLFLRKNKTYSKEKENIFYALIQELIINNSYKIALAELFQCDSEIRVSNQDRYYYYLGMTYLFNEQISEADRSFQNLSYAPSIDTIAYANTIKKIENTLQRKHRRAKVWSALLPGLGQTINGDARDGLNSFTINGSLVAIFIHIAKSLSFADAVLTVVPWFGRFYIGGIKNAGLASQAFQSKKLKEHSSTLIKLLEESNK